MRLLIRLLHSLLKSSRRNTQQNSVRTSVHSLSFRIQIIDTLLAILKIFSKKRQQSESIEIGVRTKLFIHSNERLELNKLCRCKLPPDSCRRHAIFRIH